jgi:hypothetical protein
MDWLKTALQIEPQGKGMIELTRQVQALDPRMAGTGRDVLSLSTQYQCFTGPCEAYDPSARRRGAVL